MSGERDLGRLLAGLDPVLAEEPYVFAVLPPGVAAADLRPFATVDEDEGLTVVVSRADADRLGLAYDYVAARITLRVPSDPAAVGMTAALSRVLADAGLSCNVLAGFFHDHLLVPWDRADEAVALLRFLGEKRDRPRAPPVPAVVRRLTDADLDAVVVFAVRAWAPVFDSMRAVLGEVVHRQLYPDWRASQARAVEQVCRAATAAWVAEVGGRPVGFVAVVHHDENADEPCSGEIEMIAVDPDFQRRGIADLLTRHALDAMRQAGLRLAVVATGGDPGHAPARAAYEKAGFTGLPLVRYYQAL